MSNFDQLLIAIDKNDIETVRSLITRRLIFVFGVPLPLALHRSAELGRVEIMRLLLDAGAKIDFLDNNGRTACHAAIENNQIDALRLLIERGADLLLVLLSVAVFNSLVDQGVDLIAMRFNQGGSLCHCVARNFTCDQDIRFVLDNCGPSDAVVNAVDDSGQTPLHWAVSNNNMSAMRVLVELGADIDRLDDEGESALLRAFFGECLLFSMQSMPCTQFLITLGADVNVMTYGLSLCHHSVDVEDRAWFCTILAAGGDLEQPSTNGDTARMIATRHCVPLPTAEQVDLDRKRIARSRLDLVRERAFQICSGLQSLEINALQLCEIMMHSFGALGSLIAFHQWWAIATTVKHFLDRKQAMVIVDDSNSN